MNQRALVIGEALVDVVHAADGTVVEHPGGSPANVALGLARLERTAELATWFADDARGELVREHLTASRVHLVPGSDGAERTSTAVATLAADGGASYVFDLTSHVPEVVLDDSIAVLHTGSIAATLQPSADEITDLCAAGREHATISYDPNVRPTIMGEPDAVRRRIERLVAGADVVKVSDEDIAWLYPGQDVTDAVRRWAAAGPALVVLTRGASGSIGLTSAGVEVVVPAPLVRVIDTVGAGDSYMTGLLDGLWSAGLLGADHREELHALDAETVQAVMTHAARIAAIVVSRAGANPPTRNELEDPA
ncbi:carbohydrate kinase family protein [Ruania albidiflava]|uniref:carbohydrate kinase family protein n=1 Tax=Ruania albidiflava TaxID=366586 RepID=UPI0023F57283|nr:carbohydrate kinase [Ruania albidiflava]